MKNKTIKLTIALAIIASFIPYNSSFCMYPQKYSMRRLIKYYPISALRDLYGTNPYITRTLLAAGADVGITEPADEAERILAIEKAIASVDLNKTNWHRRYQTLLEYVIRHHSRLPGTAETLLDFGASVNDSAEQDSALHQAASHWSAPVTAKLLHMGADVSAHNYSEETPLSIAIQPTYHELYWRQLSPPLPGTVIDKQAHLETVKLLLQAGADPNETCKCKILECDNPHTALQRVAVYASHVDRQKDVLRLLLEHGADMQDDTPHTYNAV